MSLNISFRPVQSTDTTFLYQVYTSTRADELQSWGWDAAQAAVFLNLQFTAQRSFYAAHFLDAEHQIILLDQQPVGQWLVNRTAEDIRLVDISLLSEYRNQGIGTQLLQDLLNESDNSNKSVRLQVRLDNPAQRLYQKLGFRQIHPALADDLYLEMEYLPASSGLSNR